MRRATMIVEPNVLPMIDVLLVLLVIFMLDQAADVRRAFDVQLPQPSLAQVDGAPIVLQVSAGPTYSVNRSPVPAADLIPRLRSIFDRRPDKVIFVDAARSLPYRTVAGAFDAVRAAGVRVTAVVPKR